MWKEIASYCNFLSRIEWAKAASQTKTITLANRTKFRAQVFKSKLPR